MHQVVSHLDEHGVQMRTGVRVGWWCPTCKHWEKATVQDKVIYAEETNATRG